jgi:hypothetical protein
MIHDTGQLAQMNLVLSDHDMFEAAACALAAMRAEMTEECMQRVMILRTRVVPFIDYETRLPRADAWHVWVDAELRPEA